MSIICNIFVILRFFITAIFWVTHFLQFFWDWSGLVRVILFIFYVQRNKPDKVDISNIYDQSLFSAQQVNSFLVSSLRSTSGSSTLSVTFQVSLVLSLGQDSSLIVVHLSQFDRINLWSLDNFNLSDSDVSDWIDSGDFLVDLFLQDFTCE